MTAEEFKTGMTRLLGVFGSEKFPKGKIEAIWEIVREMPSRWFDKTVSKMIRTNQYAPMPAHFYEEAMIEKNKSYSELSAHQKPFPETNENVIKLLSDFRNKRIPSEGA